ncbi:UDP-3-O-[3-hydroxymyristoyl] glucosamine N-acyltransferase [Magnetococcus marinus MC-1]|uniref:UDP-3-O-[3-hydroxymyristoyl] glucosamine N-acyltransferase n=1 Tax=Magnetococcus marinus (strain ATCC BAA-1437 / JCM 17883 / MC-1) TaxID=156889 RepID=A0L7I5_MAGMM|nr:UDP-3-O-(3-hydroxymyristoyl)glucosamine N-acyltransferase [Magnetococcus marinus]ABK43928.1 UDP-3-O-[3-hydroxymyristoyl] glucosamine N-acyltransferase [Magnetococcus marinus MC-1]
MKLSDLASQLQLPMYGEDVPIKAVAPVEWAAQGDLSFVGERSFLEKGRAAAALLVTAEVAEAGVEGQPYLISPAPALDAGRAGVLLGMQPFSSAVTGVHPTAVVDPSARIGAGVSLGPYVVVEAEAILGDGVVLHPGVVVHQRCQVGAGSIIHSGAVIGADGFGYQFVEGSHQRIPHFGCVVIEEGVEIGANTTIDRARFGETRIGAGTRIDNQVQIGHNVQVGKHCVIVSQVGIAGSCVIGDYVVIAGQAGLAPHVEVGRGARIAASTGLAGGRVPAGETWSGWWGQPHRDSMLQLSAMRKLPAFMKQVKAFMKKMESDA